VFVDFDGTLSPIVADAASASLLPGAVDALAALASLYAVVAVVSGRPAGFLASRVPVPGVERWGAYGLESVTPSGAVMIDPAAEAWRPAVAAAVVSARAAAPPGVVVEDKGIAVTLHYRSLPSAREWAVGFALSESARSGLSVHEARMSVELRPPVHMDKGVVIARATSAYGLAAACAIGDDLGDLPAFRALDDVDHPLRVAVGSAEAPAALLEAADLVVDGPPGVLALLKELAG
jgi:trehalose 6-phosphate phosphatase